MTETNVIVRLSTSFGDFPILRQTPGSKGRWGRVKFEVESNCEKADWWIVSSGLTNKESCRVDPSKTVFVANEPPSRRYPAKFLAQFGAVVSCDPDLEHHNRIDIPYGLPWWAGVAMDTNQPHRFETTARFSYDDFRAMRPNRKRKMLSIIMSRQTALPGHRDRLHFLQLVKKRFPKNIDVFGYSDNPIPDKWDALYDYKYHLSIENTSCFNYWSEKISDPYLAYSLPIYHGCPNIGDFFPNNSFVQIQISDPKASLATIEHLMEGDNYELYLPEICAARQLVLNKYNFFAQMAELCKPTNGHFSEHKLYPEHYFERSTVNPSLRTRIRTLVRFLPARKPEKESWR